MNEQSQSQNMNYNILPTSTMAIISLIAGIAGFSFLPVIGTIVALITGYSARNETRAVPPTASGDGLATAGIVMGWVQVGLSILGICLFILFFGFFASLIGISVNQ